MLTDLYIRNFAVIEEMRLQPDAGLTILSGEEGAGKSLIVDALGALLGLKQREWSGRAAALPPWKPFFCPTGVPREKSPNCWLKAASPPKLTAA